MNNQILQDTIRDWYSKTPDSVHAVGWGYKRTNDVCTDELCVIFSVLSKKPLTELTQEEILPTSLIIDNETIKTDVIQRSRLFRLKGHIGHIGGSWGSCTEGENNSNAKQHRAMHRPLIGGIEIRKHGETRGGTLGGLFRDKDDGSVVGLTNAHVALAGLLETALWSQSSRSYNADANIQYDGAIAQPISDGFQVNMMGDFFPDTGDIGDTKRYYPLIQATPPITTDSLVNFNYIDAAVIGIEDSKLLGPYSGSQLGPKPPVNYGVATTAEIDGLVSNRNILSKSGRTTGYVDTLICTDPICRNIRLQYENRPQNSIIAKQLNYTFNLDSTIASPIDLLFTDCILFSFNAQAKDSYGNWQSLPNVCVGGDSGSLLLADFNGVKKIVGLIFAGGPADDDNPLFDVAFWDNQGLACRIDTVMSLLNLEAIGPNDQKQTNPQRNWSYALIDVPVTSSYIATKTIDNMKFWECGQIGNKTVYVTYGTKQTPPRNVVALGGNKEIGVTWDAPLVAGPVPIIGYKIQYSSSNGVAGSWTSFESPLSPLRLALITGLTNGKRYVVRVRSINADSRSSAFSANSTPVLCSP